MKRIRTVAVFPTMFTLANLVCGFFAIVVAARVAAPLSAEMPRTPTIDVRHPIQSLNKENPVHNIMVSGWLIFLAMVFDALDGYVARLSNATSDFGAQLDSLCDVVTFGVAPGFLLVKMCPRFEFLHSEAVWVIAASFAACAAMRLARFNVETGEEDDHTVFSGLPSPAAAGAIAGFAILFYTLRVESNQEPLWLLQRLFGWEVQAERVDLIVQTILPFFGVLVAMLMVSRIPYPHLVNQILRSKRSFGQVVALVFGLVAIMVVRGYSVPILCFGFVLGPPLWYFYLRITQRQAREEPLF